MEGPALRTAYLTGETLYLRAPVEKDEDAAAAWLQAPFPINRPRAEALLKEEYGRQWGTRGGLLLVVVRRDDEAVVGGARVRSRSNFRRTTIELTMAPWEAEADRLRAEALRILVPWLRDEIESMVVGTTVASDQPATIQAAEEVGMVRNGTLREWYARPGGRADALVYEALNPRWEVADA